VLIFLFGNQMAQRSKTKKTGRQRDLRLGFHLHDVSRLRRTLFDNKMKPLLGITRSQWIILDQLTRDGGNANGMLQTELAQILVVDKMAVGGLINRLEAGGFVVRKPDKEDKRARRILITAKGRAVSSRMVILGAQINSEILSGIRSDDIAATVRVLLQMKENLRGLLGRDGLDDDAEL